MTVQPTRDQLRALADTVLDGGHYLADEEEVAIAQGVRHLLDQLDRAEHRIARLEAQTSIRGRAVVMYRERARTAEAERDAARGYISELETAVQSRNDVIKHRDARIKAVRALHTGTRWPGVTDEPICDACDQPWPCPTIRALDGHA